MSLLAMHTKQTLQADLKRMGIDPKRTVLAHFSYNSLGEVEGGAKVLYHKTRALYDALVPMLEENPGLFNTTKEAEQT
jgi:aminoglycoside N3'-acetyltransferase